MTRYAPSSPWLSPERATGSAEGKRFVAKAELGFGSIAANVRRACEARRRARYALRQVGPHDELASAVVHVG